MKNTYQKGLTLIETSVSLFILSGVLYLVAQQAGVFNKTKAQATFSDELIEHSHKIELALSDPVVCKEFTETLVPGYIPPSSPTLAGNGGQPTVVQGPRIGEGHGGVISRSLRSKQLMINPDAGLPGEPPEIRVLIAKENLKISARLSIKSLQLVNDGRTDFIRVMYVQKADANGVERTMNRDFPIIAKKSSLNEVVECSSQSETAAIVQCGGVKDAVWNSTTQKCDLPSHLKRARTLIKVYKSPSGAMMTEHLELAKINTPFGLKPMVRSCQCSGQRCTFAPNCQCSVPACPAPLRTEVPSRRVTVSQTIGKKCEMQAYCYNQIPIPPSTPTMGHIVTP